MKKAISILAMLLIAATAYNQTSRRPANNNNTAQRSSRENNSVSKKTTSSNNQRQSRNAVVKTKHSDSRTYHYERSAPAIKSSTQQTQKPASTQHRQSNSEAITRTPKTNSTRKTTQVADSRVIRTSTIDKRNSYHKAGETHKNSRSRTTVTYHKEYNSPRTYRGSHTAVHHYYHRPASRSYRAKHYVYRRPVNYNIIWTPVMHRQYIRMYPMVKYWHYANGYHIDLVSAYDAEYYRGQVRTVYGRVAEVYYSPGTDEYFLYFGLYYPYQDFTVVLPGYIARRYNHHPERYFTERHVAVTGLITTFNGEPEIVVKESFQINLY
jgi:hypothetical protein